MTHDFLPAEYEVPFEDELKDRTFNRVLDGYLINETLTLADYESLTETQRAIIQTIKRSIKRIKSKYAKSTRPNNRLHSTSQRL